MDEVVESEWVGVSKGTLFLQPPLTSFFSFSLIYLYFFNSTTSNSLDSTCLVVVGRPVSHLQGQIGMRCVEDGWMVMSQKWWKGVVSILDSSIGAAQHGKIDNKMLYVMHRLLS